MILDFRFKNKIDSRQLSSGQGSILIYNIVIIFIFSLVMMGALAYAAAQMRLTRSTIQKEMAFEVAEAGANYYQWHLAHFSADYWDGHGSSTPGPYVHEYFDKDTGQKIGEFSLKITPPYTGSTVVTIESTGFAAANPKNKRKITVRYGIPSLARYAFLTNSDVWIGDTESVSGEMHANGGIRFDGTGNAAITSAKSNIPPGPGYRCYYYHGCNYLYENKPGIWGAALQATQNFWRMSASTISFTGFTANFQDIETDATEINLPPSNAQGYSLVFKNDGTIDIYKVTSLISEPTGWDVNGAAHNENLTYNQRTWLYNKPIPENGLIFIKDRFVWVEGTVKGRALVAVTKYSTDSGSQGNILIPNNILYAAKDGTNVLGLIAEKDIIVTYNSPTNLEIDAALVAQKGSVQHYNYASSSWGCPAPVNVKNSITIYGTIASFGVWTWSWLCSDDIISGYRNTSTVYDSSLLYAPPPSFPLTNDGYQQISWSSN